MAKFKTVCELLEDPNRWVQGFHAINKDNSVTGIRSSDAIRWCSMGAIMKVYKNQNEIDNVIEKVCEEIGNRSITYWNDTNSHEKIYNVFKKLGI